MTDTPHFSRYDTRLAAYAVIIEERDGVDQVLLALWNEPDQPRWTLPGGGVELHETVEQAAKRELLEETGYEVEIGAVIGVDSFVIDAAERYVPSSRPMKGVRVIFTATIIGGALAREIDGSTDEARWFPLTAVPALPQVDLVSVGIRMRLG